MTGKVREGRGVRRSRNVHVARRDDGRRDDQRRRSGLRQRQRGRAGEDGGRKNRSNHYLSILASPASLFPIPYCYEPLWHAACYLFDREPPSRGRERVPAGNTSHAHGNVPIGERDAATTRPTIRPLLDQPAGLRARRIYSRRPRSVAAGNPHACCTHMAMPCPQAAVQCCRPAPTRPTQAPPQEVSSAPAPDLAPLLPAASAPPPSLENLVPPTAGTIRSASSSAVPASRIAARLIGSLPG